MEKKSSKPPTRIYIYIYVMYVYIYIIVLLGLMPGNLHTLGTDNIDRSKKGNQLSAKEAGPGEFHGGGAVNSI